VAVEFVVAKDGIVILQERSTKACFEIDEEQLGLFRCSERHHCKRQT
jgi:hypothetical protein